MNFKLLPLLILTLFSVNLFAAPSPAVTYGVLNTNDFRVTNSIVSLRGSSPGGSNIIYNLYTSNFFVTNITVQTITVESNLFTTNLFVTNLYSSNIYTTNLFVTNIDASTIITTNLYVTNLFVTYEVVSNIVAGNINGTVPHLSMFYPDGFSLTDSIVTQNTNDNNGITVNGTGDGYIVLSDGGAGIPYVDFGDNGTNRLYRSGSQLIYTNTAITGNGVTFVIINGAGVQTQVGVDQDSQSVIRADTGHVVKIEPNAGTQVYYATSGAFYPSDFLTLGLAERPWGPLYLGGFNDHATTTNFARLEVYHGGTNSDIIFDSQASGIAGNPRDFALRTGNTNRYKFVADLPAAFDGIRVYGANGTKYATYGADSTGADAHVGGGVNGGVWLNPNLGSAGNFGAFDNSFVPDHSGAKLGSGVNPWGILYLGSGVTKAQKALLTPFDGMVVYQTDNTPGLRAYINGAWVILTTAADP